MPHTIRDADEATRVLLVHAPYPGRLKFDGEPSSLLYAATPLLETLEASGRGGEAGLFDPREASEAAHEDLARILRSGGARVVAISTSSAAILETTRIVALVRALRGPSVLVVLGGPHEDDCETKCAEVVPGVDLSIAGEAEYLLAAIVTDFLAGSALPAEYCRSLLGELSSLSVPAGRGQVTSRHWDAPFCRPFDFGPIDLDQLPPRVRSPRAARFSVFGAARTLPLMISRGCAYGRCTFCAEGSGEPASSVLTHFDWISRALAEQRGDALYFQDSIFPNGRAVTDRLLPILRDLGVPWGCQLYLPMLGRKAVDRLARHGCRYVYTGIESGSPEILGAVGKGALSRELLFARLDWIRDSGMRVGLSVMFGAMNDSGQTLETHDSVESTAGLCEQIVERRVRVAGFYPNVETVLPGTRLARQLAARGVALDWYRPPRSPWFEELEDGGVGFNFTTVGSRPDASGALVEYIRRASARLVALGDAAW